MKRHQVTTVRAVEFEDDWRANGPLDAPPSPANDGGRRTQPEQLTLIGCRSQLERRVCIRIQRMPPQRSEGLALVAGAAKARDLSFIQ